jgi:hypothetical protein
MIKLNVELDRKQKIVISIFDIQGRKLYEKSATYGQGKQEIQFTPGVVPSGNYILKVTGDTFTETKKITKQ